jgi:hypothetical protein
VKDPDQRGLCPNGRTSAAADLALIPREDA